MSKLNIENSQKTSEGIFKKFGGLQYKKVGWKVYYFSLVGFHVAYNFIDTFVHFVIFKCDCYTHNATSAWLLFLVSFITSLFTWPDSDMRFHNVGSIWNFNHHEFHIQHAFHVGWYHAYTVRRDTWETDMKFCFIPAWYFS